MATHSFKIIIDNNEEICSEIFEFLQNLGFTLVDESLDPSYEEWVFSKSVTFDSWEKAEQYISDIGYISLISLEHGEVIVNAFPY